MEIVDQGVVYKNKLPSLRHFQARQPAVRALSEKEFLVAYGHGIAMESIDNTVGLVRTTDGGKSWQHEGFVVPPAVEGQPPYCSYAAPELAVMKNGDLSLLSVRFWRDGAEDIVYNPKTGGIRKAETTYFISKDKGKTWQGPNVIPTPEGFVGYACGTIVETRDNKWMVGFETWKAFDDTAPAKTRNFVLISSDEGKTWDQEYVIVEDLEAKKSYWDVIYSTLNNGTIFGLMWTHDPATAKDLPLHRTYSEDCGRTWLKPEPTNLQGQINITVDLGDGRLMIIYNRRNCDDAGIYITTSEDMGKTWNLDNQVLVWNAHGRANIGTDKGETFLDNWATFAFGRPDIHRIDDKHFIIVFWATEDMITQVRWCKLAL